MRKVNFHWGHGITIFYVIFVGALIWVLIASRKVDRSLVRNDYYELDLNYQERYEKIQRTIRKNAISTHIGRDRKELLLSFNGRGEAVGSIHLYRPNDKESDLHKTFSGREWSLPMAELAKGKWRLKVEWDQGGESYYHEETIYL